MQETNYFKNKLFWILALLCFLSLFLFLGQALFNTRGEPREALVGMAMLESGNWTLPTTNGVDIAYKPPFFHWSIASISSFIGNVTEYTSRMPSAISLTIMLLGGFVFYAKRRGKEIAFLASLITLTNFEIHRAGTNCRVDMLLAALMVLALYELYRWTEKDLKGLPWKGILLLSGAFLTKGPVGLVLPCLVAGIYTLIRGVNFWRAFISFIGVGLLSLTLPMIWYFAAWKQGGEQFLDLVIEENVLRFLGKMSYESHINPWHYNVMTVVTGFVPYTLLLLLSAFTIKKMHLPGTPKEWWKKLTTSIQTMEPTRLYTLLCIVVMFVFYCIPKSKRSVYLLPIYPFIAYFIAEYIVYLSKRKPNIVRIYNAILCGLAILLFTAFLILKCQLIPHSLFQEKSLPFLMALGNIPLGVNLISIALPLIAVFFYIKTKESDHKLAYGGGLIAFSIFFSLDGTYLPAILNTKSNKNVAEYLQANHPDQKVYSYITQTAKGNRMHPFTVNFYLKDTIVPFYENKPNSGIVILNVAEYSGFMEKYGKEYLIEKLPFPAYKSCDDRIMTSLYSFKKKE